MNTGEIQQQLFAEIKRKIGETASAADEIAKLLDISTDSAYRRMRGEKTISIDELYTLCFHYKISLDQMMNIPIGAFMFKGNLLDSKTFRFDTYMTGMMHTLAYFNSYKKKEFYYLCKDVPVVYHWQCRELAAFKYFFWMSTLFHFPEFRNRKVSLNEYPDEMWNLGQKILELYNQLDGYELWNLESLTSTLNQIEYYRNSNLFLSDLDVLKVYESVEKILDHLEEQARLGYKFKMDDPAKKPLGKYHMYLNEILIMDNSMLAIMDDTTRIVLIPHTVINYMMSSDVAYCENYHDCVQNLMRRSTLVSEVSEKERSRFFRILRERTARRKEALKV